MNWLSVLKRGENPLGHGRVPKDAYPRIFTPFCGVGHSMQTKLEASGRTRVTVANVSRPSNTRSALGAFKSSPDAVNVVLNVHSFSPTPTEVTVTDQAADDWTKTDTAHPTHVAQRTWIDRDIGRSDSKNPLQKATHRVRDPLRPE
jgi:hypothetical protein